MTSIRSTEFRCRAGACSRRAAATFPVALTSSESALTPPYALCTLPPQKSPKGRVLTLPPNSIRRIEFRRGGLSIARPQPTIPARNSHRMVDSICIFACGENKCSHQFLNWWQQHATGMLHINGFESHHPYQTKKPRP